VKRWFGGGVLPGLLAAGTLLAAGLAVAEALANRRGMTIAPLPSRETLGTIAAFLLGLLIALLLWQVRERLEHRARIDR
jgi:hypothetical protein